MVWHSIRFIFLVGKCVSKTGETLIELSFKWSTWQAGLKGNISDLYLECRVQISIGIPTVLIKGLRGLPQSLQNTASIIFCFRPRSFPYTSFPIRHLLIIIPVILWDTASLNKPWIIKTINEIFLYRWRISVFSLNLLGQILRIILTVITGNQ
jgi:hypothetical protein